MLDNRFSNMTEVPIAGLSQELIRSKEVIDTYVKERLNQASKTNKDWCAFYNKMLNVGWIIGNNNVFFFQYLPSQNSVNRSFVEFPKNQSITTPEQVKIFKIKKDFYTVIVFPNLIQISRILTSTEEKDVIEILRFPRQSERIISISESWDDGGFVYFTVFTNKNSLYLIQLEIRVVDLRLETTVTLHILNRKTKLLQKIKSYITPETDLESQEAFCCMHRRTLDPTRSSMKTYDVFSYAEGKLELLTLSLEQQNGKYFPSSHLYKWVINLESILQHELTRKLYENLKKFRDLQILDFHSEVTKNSTQVILRLLLRVTLVNHTHLEGYFSFVTVTLNDLNGDVIKIEEDAIGEAFKIDMNILQAREQVFYGRIIAELENNNIYVCVHFSLKPKEGTLEIEESQADQINLFVEIDNHHVNSLPLRDKILGAGHYFDYEQNEEDVLLVITEIDVVKMKVLKHINVSQTSNALRQPSVGISQSIRVTSSFRRESERPVASDVESIRTYTVGNVLGTQFKEILSNARDNYPALKLEVENIQRNYRPQDVLDGLQSFTNEILRAKNRNLVLASTYISPKPNKKKEQKAETSDILLHEIKKKLKVMNAWMEFLRKVGLWDIQGPIRELVYSNKEKLLAALKLREQQIALNSQSQDDPINAEKKNLLFQAILECLRVWGLEAKFNSDYVNNDVFYTKIENFGDFIISLISIHKDFVDRNNSFQFLSFVAQTIIAVFDALYEERGSHNYEDLPLWSQEETLLNSMTSFLTLLIRGLTRVELETETLKKDLSRFGYILIREYNNISKLWPEQRMWDEKMEEIYTALLNSGVLADSGKYAEEFTHIDIIARLYYEYNYDHHIKELFSKWSHLDFLERFIDSYVNFIRRNPQKATGPFKLFQDFEEFSQRIDHYTCREYPQIAWIFAIKNGEFMKGENLIRKISPVENLVRNRLAEAAMGKLCTSFYDKEISSEYDKLLRIDLVQYKSTTETQILPPQTIINDLLNSGSERNHTLAIQRCLKILANILRNSYYSEIVPNEYQKILASVISKAIAFDRTKIDAINSSLGRGEPQEIINHRVSETCLWPNFDEILRLVEGQGINLEKFVEEVVGGTREDRIVIQQMRALRDSGVVLNAGTMF